MANYSDRLAVAEQVISDFINGKCNVKKVEIIGANACPDHIHMLVKIPPNISVAQFMGYLKGKSTFMIFDRHANLKYKYGNRHFWCRGYYVDTFTYLYGHYQTLLRFRDCLKNLVYQCS